MFNPSAFQHSLPLFHLLLPALFYHFPQLIREHVYSLVQFIFGSVILSKIRVLVTECVEFLNESL